MRHLFASSIFALTLVSCSAPRPFTPLQSAQQAQSANFQRFSTGDWFAPLPADQKSYYQAAQGQQGDALFASMHKIISNGSRTPSYNGARSFMYGNADQVQSSTTPGLVAAYSELFIPGRSDNGNAYKEQGDANRDGQSGDFINCEHTWPQSFFDKRLPMKADMHHLFPTLSKPNSMRNNHPLGMATGVVVYQTANGSKLGVIDKTGKHNPQDIKQWYNMPWNQQPHDVMRRDLQAIFEPSDVQKGNTARAMLYFYLRYHNENIRTGAFKEDVYWDQQVKTYIQWAKADPVDAQERSRHEKIAREQNNRNPFVDIPDLASAIGEKAFVETF